MNICSDCGIIGILEGGAIMPSLSTIKSDISSLNNIQITELFEYIGQLITVSSIEQDLQKDFKKNISLTDKYVQVVALFM